MVVLGGVAVSYERGTPAEVVARGGLEDRTRKMGIVCLSDAHTVTPGYHQRKAAFIDPATILPPIRTLDILLRSASLAFTGPHPRDRALRTRHTLEPLARHWNH